MIGLDRARALVMAHGWNATAYQILNPGVERWFAPEGDAVVGFARHARVRVVAGAPVCALERLPDVVAAFESDAAAAGEAVCYFGAEGRLEGLFQGRADRAAVRLGAQPFWDPSRWPETVATRASLRAQLYRAANHGVTIATWSASKAHRHPDLERCLGRWLGTKGLPPLTFLVDPRTLGLLDDRRVFVATREGGVVGFLVASPIPRRRGWLVEQIVRDPSAPNGTAEALVDAAMRALAAEGAACVTLGLAPLARRGASAGSGPLWTRLVFGAVRRHGRPFYDFAGLEAFKAKLHPDRWDPVFAFAAAPRFTPRMLWAVAGVFGGGSLPALVLRALTGPVAS